MLTGAVPWPEEFAARYRRDGLWTDETFWDLLCAWSAAYGERTALVAGERRWSYHELQRRASRLAAGLRRLGVDRNERVVVQLPNVPEFVALCFALFRIGAIPVLALPAHRRSEITCLCEYSRAVAYVVPDMRARFDYRVLADEVRACCKSIRHTIVLGDAGSHVAFDSLYDDAAAPQVLISANDVALFQLSGGTTGVPKLIPRTHADYSYSVRVSAQICGLDVRSTYLAVLPIAHNFPLSSPGILGTLHAGGKVVLAENGSPDEAFDLIARERVTITAVVPPLALVWMEEARERHYDLTSLEVLQVGGAKLSVEAARRVRPILGCQLQQVFGMAEGLVNYTRLDDQEELVLVSQGRPMSLSDEIRIVDDDDAELPMGETGHLLTRGPYTIRGYFEASAHNARAFTSEGFYRTGDLVRLLPSGHLVVEGRSKDLINRGGDKVCAEEIENHLLAHPAILDVALVAMPDALLGERTCAFVIPRVISGTEAPSLNTIKIFLRNRGVADFKLPDRIEVVDSFAETSVGKVSKKALREAIARKVSSGQREKAN